MALIGKVFVALGAVTFVGAVAWWYAFFSQFLGSNVKDASQCFYSMADGLCRANHMLEMVGSVPAYSPLALWLSAGAAALGIVLIGFAPAGKRQ